MRFSQWQPFGSPVLNTLQGLQREMNRVFDRWGQDGASVFGFAGYPAVNVWEDTDNVFVEAELPGLDLKDLTIYATGGNRLTIKGERKQQQQEKTEKFHRVESFYGSFERSFALPENVNEDAITSENRDGVLSIHIPKAQKQQAKPKEVSVQ